MPTLSEMFQRLLRAEGQSRAAHTVESFGWLDLTLGVIMLNAPYFTASLLGLPELSVQASNYLRLVGLLVSGLGMLYIVSGRLNAQGFVFASLLDRPLVPLIMAVLWRLGFIPGPLALAFAISDFGGFLWTLSAWRTDARLGPDDRPKLTARIACGVFGFASGVIRNSRVFHPDGRVFLGTVESLNPADPTLARAADQLTGAVLLRMGMGLMKRGMPLWIADHIPDAPSIATRFYTPATPTDIRLERRAGEDLDLLSTAGGDRLWKLVLNLATGGRSFGLRHFDYFQNLYFADVPYKIDDGKLEVYIRLAPETSQGAPTDGPSREKALSEAVERHATLRVEAQRTDDNRAPFVPIAQIRFEREIQVDQEALHFDPLAGRGFVPHGYLTDLRKRVYPASVRSRPHNQFERKQRDHESIWKRLALYFNDEGEGLTMRPTDPGKRHWVRWILLAVVVLCVVYLALRFTQDRPVDYADNEMHFRHGSTGGERLDGIPIGFGSPCPNCSPNICRTKRRAAATAPLE